MQCRRHLLCASSFLLFLTSLCHSFAPLTKISSHSTMASACSKPEAGKCVPCETLDPSALLPRDEIDRQVKQHDQTRFLWTVIENAEKKLCLSRSFVAKNFQCALDAVNAMGAIAEREGHHPDFHITSYRNVDVVLYTHTLGGITQNDISLARMLDDEVEVVYSPKWRKEHLANVD